MIIEKTQPSSRRFRFGIRSLLLAVAGIAVVLVLHINSATYETWSLVRIHRGPATGGIQNYMSLKERQMALLLDRDTLDAAVQSPAVANLRWIRRSDPAAYLRAHLKVDHVGQSEIFRVRMVGNPYRDRPEHLEAIVDAVVDAYLRKSPPQVKVIQRATTP